MNHEGHDDREGHEDHPFWRRYHVHVSSPLMPEAEEVMTQTIGCAIAVHRALGPGFLESIYKKAMQGLVVVELKAVIRLDDVHTSQLVSYLRTTGLRGGLLINFRVALLQQGLRRVVL